MTFDTAARDRLRSKLLGYMKQHAIGVPALQARIAEATDRPTDLIVLKTLQRFLGKQGRTHDGFLIPCFQFAESLPERDEMAGIAGELAGFFAMPLAADNQGQDRPRETEAASLAGRFKVWTKPPLIPGKMKVLDADESQFTLAYSKCAIRERGGSLRIREEVFNGGMENPAPSELQTTHHSFEGIVLFFDPVIFVLSRNVLTRLPRAYWLRRYEGDVLAGSGMEAAFSTDKGSTKSYEKTVDFMFARIPDEAEDGS
ncbi:hypothetical protein RHECNPAF_1780010 [Rhizobium etli CNPAF512]|nr:hypothetical protein RHECNPAF_1780010 [Rhizobium etli CNPAF512]